MTDSEIIWLPPPTELVIRENEVHIWRAFLDLPILQISSLRQVLSSDEVARADRLRSDRDRWRFIAARSTLRTILGLYLNMEPGRIAFHYASFGKPALAEGLTEDDIRFNLAHSKGLALFAFTVRREIGVDLEKVRSDLAYMQLADRFFSDSEISILHALSPTDALIGFFKCWTRKEAYIKAKGKGIFHSLKQFDVSLSPGHKAELLSTVEGVQETNRWSLEEITPAPGYIGALAIEGHDYSLKFLSLN